MKRFVLPIIMALGALIFTARAQTVSTVATDTLFEPYGVVVDPASNLYYISDSSLGGLRVYSPKSGLTSLLAGDIGANPAGLALATRVGLGKVLVFSDTINHQIHYYKIATGESGLLAGSARGNTDGPGATAKFFSPTGVAADTDGTIYVADLQNNRVRKIANDAAATVSTVAPGAGFYRPAAVALDYAGRLFVADSGNDSIKVIDTATGALTGSELLGYNGPRGLLWVGGATGLLVSDSGDSVIRSVLGRSGRSPALFAGVEDSTGQTSAGQTDGAIDVAKFSEPVGLARDVEGNVIIADLKNNKIRRLTRSEAQPPVVNPASGLYTNAVTVTVSDPVPAATPGSTYRYTVDGQDPTPLSPEFPGSLVLDGGPVSLKVRAFHPDRNTSLVVSNNYSFFINPLAINVPGGSFSNDVRVAAATLTDGAVIHYKTDGTTPDNTSPVWSNQTLSNSVTLVLKAFKPGYTDSSVLSNAFNFAVNPLFMTPAGGSFTNDTPIQISSQTAGARIYFTTDDSEPTEVSEPWTNRNSVLSGNLRARGFRAGYAPSPIITNTFNFVTATPVMNPATAATNNSVGVSITSGTKGSTLLYTINGANPPVSLGTNNANFSLATNGTWRVIAVKPGYKDSDQIAGEFTLRVSDPTIEASTNVSDNPIPVTLRTKTEGATFAYTFDGTQPTPGGGPGTILIPAGANGSASISVTSDGPLKVVAYRNGFLDSAIVTTPFTLKAATPKITLTTAQAAGSTLAGSTNINKVYAQLATATTAASIYYTLDGSIPDGNGNGILYTNTAVLIDTNATIQAIAVVPTAGNVKIQTSDVATKVEAIMVDTPVMTPPRGFFQEGTLVSLTVQRGSPAYSTAARIYYTLDGSEPTVTNTLYTAPFKINAVGNSTTDLRLVRARAFADGTLPSDIVSGSAATNNTIGITQPVKAGIGATVVIPVVAGLKPGDDVRSIQFRVHVWPMSAGAPNLAFTAVDAPVYSTNRLVHVIGGDDGVTYFNSYRLNQLGTTLKTNDIAIYHFSTNATRIAHDYSTVQLLSVRLPTNAKEGDVYGIRVVEPSGTKDGNQDIVTMIPSAAQTITITKTPYLVGDSSPSGWYNAGDFGDGALDNADVNNALQLSLPGNSIYRFSDLFNSMDVFPVDEDGFAGGDGQIRLLDWQIILMRSLGRDPENWNRSWIDGGVLSATAVTLPNGSRQARGSVLHAASTPGQDWYRPVLLEAESVANVEPGATVRVPVYLDVKPGHRVATLQFVAEVQPASLVLANPARFIPAPGIPAGFAIQGQAANRAAHAWTVDQGLLVTERTLLGYVEFEVPANSVVGDCLTVRFLNADAAPNLRTQYDLETIAGCVGVRAKIANIFGRLPDEWRTNFFGSVDSPVGRPEVDADGDGVTNDEEFRRGTSPTKLRFQVDSKDMDPVKPGFKLRWFAIQGRKYVVECSPSATGPWTIVAEGVIGDGTLKEVIDNKAINRTQFYRLRGE